MKKWALLLSMFFMVFGHPFAQTTDASQDNIQRSTHNMNLHLNINNQIRRATLNNSQAAQDFYALLPLTLKLEDYASAEKFSHLPRKLRTTDSPAGSSSKTGDIAYYAPWGNLVLFYDDARYASGLVILGHIKGNIDMLRGKGDLQVTIEAAQ